MSKVVCHFIYPPIPMRQFDWCATYEDEEPDDAGNMDKGYGPTEQEAIADLLTNFPRDAARERDREGER